MDTCITQGALNSSQVCSTTVVGGIDWLETGFDFVRRLDGLDHMLIVFHEEVGGYNMIVLYRIQ